MTKSEKCVICGGGRDEHGPIAARAHNFEAEVLGASMSDSTQKPSHGIEEIVERKLNEHFEQLEDRELATGFGLAVAKAVVEECAKIVEETPFAYGTLVGKRQRDLKQRAACTIRALAVQGAGGEKGR